jgi:chaperonin GroEL (HSP60 family)
MQYIPAEKKPLSGELWEGYDLKQQKIVDMFEAGIIDSVNVAKSVIIDSISLCTVLVEVEIGLGRTTKNISTFSLKELNKSYSSM